MTHAFELVFYRKKREKGNRSAPAWQYLGRIGEIGFAIAIPIAGGALVGAAIDRSWSTSPHATLSFLFIGIIVAMVNVVTMVKTMEKEP